MFGEDLSANLSNLFYLYKLFTFYLYTARDSLTLLRLGRHGLQRPVEELFYQKDFCGSDRDVHSRFMDAMTLVMRCLESPTILLR